MIVAGAMGEKDLHHGCGPDPQTPVRWTVEGPCQRWNHWVIVLRAPSYSETGPLGLDLANVGRLVRHDGTTFHVDPVCKGAWLTTAVERPRRRNGNHVSHNSRDGASCEL